jgi:hypothetical protein
VIGEAPAARRDGVLPYAVYMDRVMSDMVYRSFLGQRAACKVVRAAGRGIDGMLPFPASLLNLNIHDALSFRFDLLRRL